MNPDDQSTRERLAQLEQAVQRAHDDAAVAVKACAELLKRRGRLVMNGEPLTDQEARDHIAGVAAARDYYAAVLAGGRSCS